MQGVFKNVGGTIESMQVWNLYTIVRRLVLCQGIFSEVQLINAFT